MQRLLVDSLELKTLTTPDYGAPRWFEAGLEELRSLGVDGFKLDGGDPEYYAQVQHHGAWGPIAYSS